MHLEEPPAHDEPDAGDLKDWQESGLSWEAWRAQQRAAYEAWRDDYGAGLFGLAVDLSKTMKGDFDE